MDFKERTYSMLIVSAAEKFNTSLREIFPEFKYCPLKFASGVNSAKRAMTEREFDFILINSPLPDEDGIRFAMDICSGKNSVVLMFLRNEFYTAVFDKVSAGGVFTLQKPTSKQMITQASDWMVSMRERLRMLEKKTVSLEDKMQEIRTINRAKWLLIDRLKMSEAEAHRFIEKQAMDRCIPKRKTAEEIIKIYS